MDKLHRILKWYDDHCIPYYATADIPDDVVEQWDKEDELPKRQPRNASQEINRRRLAT